MSNSDDFRAALVADMMDHGWACTQFERVSLTNGSGHEMFFAWYHTDGDRIVRLSASIHVNRVGRYEHKVHGDVSGRANPENAQYVARDMRWGACVEAGVPWAG